MDEIDRKEPVGIDGVSHEQDDNLTLDNVAAENQTQDAALSNSIILSKIMDFFKSPKTLRLVSRDWNDAVLSGQPRLSLNLNSMPEVESSSEWKTLLDTMNPNLCKRVILTLKDRESHESLLHLEKFFLISKKYGSNITQLSITCWSESVVILVQILNDDSCPNITHLTIRLRKGKTTFYPAPTKDFTRKIQNKLKLAHIQVNWRPGCNADTQFSRFHSINTFLSNLLAAAPNLLHFDIQSPLCPSLERNKKLKFLRFDSVYNELFCPKDSIFNMAYFSVILDQVKHSLETLILETYSAHVDCGKCDLSSRHFQFPIMPKLSSFTSKYRTVAGVDGVLSSLWINRFPSLTSLSINLKDINRITRNIESLQNILKIGNYDDDDGTPMRNIKSLILNPLDEDCSKMLSQLKSPFPRLSRLDLYLTQERIPTSEWVGEVLKSCSTLGLHCLKITSEFSYKMSQMVDLLWECRVELFSSLKTLEIINQGEATDDLAADGRAMFRSILIMAKGMKCLRLDGFLLRAGHAKNVFEYITDNQLPVLFTD